MTVHLPASKSLANRALIIQALAPAGAVEIENLSDAADTQTLRRLLGEVADGATLDCGPAGTTFRFLTAYLCTRPGTQTLTGSPRMLERPVGPLVDALRALGAQIDYLGVEGYPPLRIGGFAERGSSTSDQSAASFGESPAAEVTVPGDISSQYLSALLLVAPVLPQGLTLRWTGELVSRPYLEMTVALMRRFGAELTIAADMVRVAAKPYAGGHYAVEADWSAASYVMARVAASAVGTENFSPNLHADSLQGDRRLVEMMQDWGVATAFEDGGARFRKTDSAAPEIWEYDFSACPDLAQTMSVLAAYHGTTVLFEGLQTLLIKETDRVAALKTELARVGVTFVKLPRQFSPGDDAVKYLQEGQAAWSGTVTFQTYHDHRMAMAFALLQLRGSVTIEDPEVVGKSWPSFWEEMDYRTPG